MKSTILGSWNLQNVETISRYYPGSSGWLQIANHYDLDLQAKDLYGRAVKGERLDVTTIRNTAASTIKDVQKFTTDASGRVIKRIPVAACTGSVLSATNYGPYGSPVDHWSGTAQAASVTVDLAHAPAPTAPNVKTSTQSILRICSESYLGYY